MMITEIFADNENEIHVLKYRPVAIKPYPNSTEGAFPLHPEDCVYKGEISCYTRSGDSLCGGYMGDIGYAVIRCGMEEP
jgi:hypothetical protein